MNRAGRLPLRHWMLVVTLGH